MDPIYQYPHIFIFRCNPVLSLCWCGLCQAGESVQCNAVIKLENREVRSKSTAGTCGILDNAGTVQCVLQLLGPYLALPPRLAQSAAYLPQ